MRADRWTIYEADPSGNATDIFRTASPFAALEELNRLRFVADQKGLGRLRAYGVYDWENPEKGDAQMELEEMLDA